MSMSVRIIEKESPNIMVNARGPQRADTVVSGIMPITVVIVVRKMGRKRSDADVMIISDNFFLSPVVFSFS